MGSSPLSNSCSCFSTNEEVQNSQENQTQIPEKKITLTRVNQVLPDDEEPFNQIIELYETIAYNTMSTGVIKSTFRKSKSLSADSKRVKFMDDQDFYIRVRNKKRKGTRSWSVADYRHRKDALRKKELYGILKNRGDTSLKKLIIFEKTQSSLISSFSYLIVKND